MAVQRLGDFALEEGIYIDAPIFIYHFENHPDYGKESTEFLKRIEQREISAVISSLGMDEVAFVLIKQKAKELLNTEKYHDIIQSLRTDKKLMEECYKPVEIFKEYVDLLEDPEGLRIVSINHEAIKHAFELGSKYGLLPRDAIHLAAMKQNNLNNLATDDEDFERVDWITLYKP